MASVAQRVLTGVTLATGVGLVLYGNELAPLGVVPWVVTGLLLGGSIWELSRMPRVCSPHATRGLAVAALAVLVLALAWCVGEPPPFTPPLAQPIFALASFYVLGVLVATLLGRGASTSPMAVPAPRLALWVIPPFPALILFAVAYGTRGLVALVLLSKVGDIFGYFIGRRFGRIKPFRVSPNKSLEGCAASLVAGIIAGTWSAWGGLLPDTGIAAGALLGGLLNLAAQAGDFLESAIKRRAEVKDSSALAGASGGVLDVVDSLLLTAPVAIIFWPFFVGN